MTISLRPGEYLADSSLTSPSGRFVLVNTRGETVLQDTSTGERAWTASGENVYGQAVLALGIDGDLTVWNHHRQPGWRSGTAGRGADRLQVTDDGHLVLLDTRGQVLWATGPASYAVAADDEVLPAEPRQADLQVCFDSLDTGRGYTVAVLPDAKPAEALARWGLTDPVEVTWQDLLASRTGEDVPVAAVAVGSSTLLLAAAPWVLDGTELTTAVRHSYDPACGWNADWSMHRDGATVAHVREEPPKRRTGLDLPEIVAAIGQMNHEQPWSPPDYWASFQSLELMCRVAGVSPVAADLRGPLLGGVLPASVVRRPVVDRPPRPDRPPLVVRDDLVVVRTDFSDDDAWAAILAQMRLEWLDDEEPLAPTDDPGWAGAGFEEVLAAVSHLPDGHDVPVVYLADAEAMVREDHAVLAASTEIPATSDDYEPEDGVHRTLRIEPGFVPVMHANLQIANMSWEEYCEQVDDPDQALTL